MQTKSKVSLIRYTPDPALIAGIGAAVCTKWEGDPLIALKGAVSCGHDSVVEHASFTFLIEGVSRALLAQLTRHRLASFSVESQRYVSYEDGFEYVIPPKVEALGEEAVERFESQMNTMHSWYISWRDMLGGGESAQEDARFVLPTATSTRILMTMNVRELKHFFSMRTCNRAQWEIRIVADEMLRQCKKVAPELFGNCGPGCVTGSCPEGKKSCGMKRGRDEWA